MEDAQVDPAPLPGKTDTTEGSSEENSAAVPGYWRQHVHQEDVRNTGSPEVCLSMGNRSPARDGPGILG